MVTSHRLYKKKKSYGYSERDETKRELYLEQLKFKQLEDLVYIDETGIDDNEEYAYAWGIRGQRIYGIKSANRNRRLSIISALSQERLIAPFVFEGPCTRVIFEAYVEKVLVPSLRPGQTVILDNASFHKGGCIIELIERAGCEVLYLPAYSPDFNPIEHYWAQVKSHLRKLLKEFVGDIYQAAAHLFQHVLT